MPDAKASPLQLPPPTAEGKYPKLSCYVPKSRASSHPNHLLLQSPGPTCSHAGDKHVLVPACNKSLASQDVSSGVLLPQATSTSTFVAVHGASTSQPCSKRVFTCSRSCSPGQCSGTLPARTFHPGHSHQAVCLQPASGVQGSLLANSLLAATPGQLA